MSGNVFEFRQALVRASKRPQKLRHEDYTTSYRNPLLEEEQEEFYRLERPSLDYATSDARRLRFLEYPQTVAA